MAERERSDLVADLALQVADELTAKARKDAAAAMDALFSAVAEKADEEAEKVLVGMSDEDIKGAGFDGRRKLRAVLADELEYEMMSEARDAIEDWMSRSM